MSIANDKGIVNSENKSIIEPYRVALIYLGCIITINYDHIHVIRVH